MDFYKFCNDIRVNFKIYAYCILIINLSVYKCCYQLQVIVLHVYIHKTPRGIGILIIETLIN